jgi:subtilisin family serine protease
VHSTNATGTAGVSGTSLSTPLVAAAIACILDARPDYSVAQLREALFATASRSDSTGLHPDPLFVEGHGLISAFRCATLGRAAADLNLDGTVDGSDLTVLISRWGVTGTPGDLWGDISGDGVVDGLDATALLSDWG